MAMDIQFILYYAFDWNAVAIPSETTDHPLSFHCLIAWDCILDSPRNKVSEMRQTCCERRSVIKHEFIICRSGIDRLLEYVMLFPEFQNLLFHRREIHLVIY